MSPATITELRKLLCKATKGELRAVGFSDGGDDMVAIERRTKSRLGWDGVGTVDNLADGRLMAAAVNALPLLLARIEELEGMLEESPAFARRA